MEDKVRKGKAQSRPDSGCDVKAQDTPVVFTEEMKKTHTILFPNMLPIHFKLMSNIFRNYGYKTELLETNSRAIVEQGLKTVHNDTCYPALLVIGQFLDAIESGKYDPSKVALLITQTGGGCRASNYIYLLRKALKKSGYGHIPVVSLNFSGLEKGSAFKLTLPIIHKLVYALFFGDLLMLWDNQCRPYETVKGSSHKLVEEWIQKINSQFQPGAMIRYRRVRETYRQILESFEKLERSGPRKPRVGVVGEIYVKYAPLANNNLEDFLLSEGAEVMIPGLLGFCMYCVYNGIEDRKIYGGHTVKFLGNSLAYQYLTSKQNDLIEDIKRYSHFDPPEPFSETVEGVKGYIGLGAKMGEGWLLTAEMVELIHSGVKNIVCTQPFGCLPNHIVAKGMMRLIKERNPQANIVAVDYDPGATKINQENRIKLMLSRKEDVVEASSSANSEKTEASTSASNEPVLTH